MQLVENVSLLLTELGLEGNTVSVEAVAVTVLSVPGVGYIDGADGVTTGGDVLVRIVIKGGVIRGVGGSVVEGTVGGNVGGAGTVVILNEVLVVLKVWKQVVAPGEQAVSGGDSGSQKN